MATRLGVDVGGTFTDLIFYDDQTGEVRISKEPTTPAAPEDGVISAVASAVPEDLVRAARYFLHGTTVGLNSLLERKGAVVGLLATRGFRDILEVRRGDRDEMYNLFWKPPPPLVPRHLRLPITERIRADGAVHRPLDPEDVRRAAAAFNEAGVTCVAIAFINAYVNPRHELEAARLLRDFGFRGEISLSHDVTGEFREYERTTTTVIDAYVRPRMTRYLGRLEARLREAGFGGALLVTRSGGGAMSFEEGTGRPVETIMSGPVAGAEGAAELARTLDLGDVIAADVGGTSFDTSLIVGGRPQMMYEGRVAGLPVQTPWVDVRSIGAGGGSIAYVDVGGLLKVGPRSAGAVPGPASYGRGGTEPTVTDAACVLGMLAHGDLAGGVRLDAERARAALRPLADRLGFTLEQMAVGVMTIVNANMANAIREITVEQGQDPRGASLVPFGGAGPLFGTLLARELEIRRIVVPPFAGNFSAWGLLGADVTRNAARTRITRLSEEGLEEANRVLQDLFAGLTARSASGDGAQANAREVGLDMRYLGQEHTLTISAPSEDGRIGAGADQIREIFTAEYLRTFGNTMDAPIEIVSMRAGLRTPLARRAREHVVSAPAVHEEGDSFTAYSFTAGKRLPFRVLQRSRLQPGSSLAGPAIILEETATTYLDAGFSASVHPSGSLFVTDTSEAV